MRRATENQGDSRTFSDYFSPKSKVKDQALQQRSSFQETPMKPSQVPNQLPHPPPRRMLPLQSPELWHKDRLGPPRYPHQHHLGPYSPSNIGSAANRPNLTPRDRLGPPHHSAQPPGSLRSRIVPISPVNHGTTAYRPQPSPPGIFHHANHQFMKDLSNQSPSCHIRRDQVTESKVSLSYSGSTNITGQRQESNKAQSSDVRSSVPTVQLHRPPVTPLLNSGAAQDVYPLPHSDCEHWSPGNSQWPSTQPSHRTNASSVPIMHSPVAPCQDQHHQQTPSSEKLIPGVDLNHLSQKRRRELEDCDDSAKKLCLEGANSDKAQTPKPTVDNSLSTSLVSQPSSRHPSVSELSHKTTEPACGQSAYLELSSTIKPTQSSCASLSPNPCIKRRPSMGAKQAFINSSQNYTVKLLEVRSPSKRGDDSLKKRSEENDKREKSSSLSSEVPQKDTGSSPYFQLGSHDSGHTQRSTSALPVKTPNRGNQVEESRKSYSTTPKPASKPNSLSPSCRTAERNKTSRLRRPVPSPDDISDLFTPDPMKYVVSPAHKTAKPKMDGGAIKSSTSQKSCSSSTVSSSTTTVTGSSCHKSQNVTATGSPHEVNTKVSSLSLAGQPEVSLPTVALERVKLENLRSFSPRDSELKNSPIASSSGKPYKDESVEFNAKHTSLLPNSLPPCALETDSATSKQTSTSHCTPLLERETSHREVIEEDPIDVELDLGLSFALDMDLTQSSHSSEEEHLLSLQEMMERATKPPDTPEKGAFSEPSTPGHHSCKSKTQPLPSTTKTGTYKNNLDQMLKEINTNKRAKEIETQLLTACKEDLLRIAEYEEAEENREEGISTEHQEFLQRYSLMSSAIREVPPGEVVFNLEKFGRIFNHDTLKLRQCMVNPQGTTQKMLLWSSPSLLRFHVNIGLFQEAYDSRSPCPAEVTRFLFKMMSVHNERMVSSQIQQALCDIACTAAYQIVKNGSKQFKVWVPSLADVALVLMNMGVAFVTLFPFENLQPPFTEGDLLADIYIKSESPSSSSKQSTFPEHNCNNILKYLSYCMDLCPRAYSDDELLLLLTVVGRVGLDTRLILQSSVELYPLQSKLVRNIRDWDNTLPRICLALTDLTDDHHNMCLLVQLLPYNTRGKQLRRHLSLSMISKLLDGNCTYRPTEPEIKLSELRPYLLRMQPSSLLRGMLSSSGRSHKDEEDMATLDQQAYYFCYSLLTLANEASNFQFFPAHQKEQLLSLCSELETHVKCDIRESEKCLYRSKVKDLVARIYTKWQMLLQRTRPLHGKLYDYWQPLPVDTLTSSQEEQEMDSCDDGEGPVMEEEDDEEEESSGTEENDVIMNADDEEKEEGDGTMDDKKETGDEPKHEDVEGDNVMDDSNATEKATDSVHEEVDEEMQEMAPQVHTESEVMDGQIETGNMERTEVETENLVERRETSKHDQEAACDLVS